MDWSIHDSIRQTVENYYHKKSDANAINIPMYDQFVTEIRKDWEAAGFDLDDPEDLFRLWGTLQVVIAGCTFMLQECESEEEAQGAIRVVKRFGNMTGLFLREMCKGKVPAIGASDA